MMARPNALMVMTARGPERILAEGGSQAWVLNPGNASKMTYVVCVQNRHVGTWGGATEPHGKVFLVGRIESVKAVEVDEIGNSRYMLKISHYCRIDGPIIEWIGRNPIRYVNLTEELKIDPESLDFHLLQLKEQDQPDANVTSEIRELTVAEAKAGLAAKFGVSPEAIEITIRV